MLFLIWHDHALCSHRINGRLLARESGLQGMSLATLSGLLGLAHRFPKGAL